MMTMDRYGWRSESRPDLAKDLEHNPMRAEIAEAYRLESIKFWKLFGAALLAGLLMGVVIYFLNSTTQIAQEVCGQSYECWQ